MKETVEKTGDELFAEPEEMRLTIAELEKTREQLKRAEAELRAKTRQFEFHRLVSLEITRELDLSVLLQIILRRAAELLGARSGFLSLYDENSQTITPQCWEGHGEWVADLVFPLGKGISGTVAAERRGMVVNNYRTSPYVRSLIIDHTTVTSIVAEPLIYGDRLIGVVTVDNEGMPERIFTEEDREILTPFAVQAAIAIENARLYAAAKQESADRIKAEAELKKNEKLYRTLIETSPDGIVVYDLTGKIITANHEAARIYGAASVEEFLAEVKTVFQVLTEEGRKMAMANFNRTLDDGFSEKNEYQIRRRNGSAMPIEINSSIIREAEGEPQSFISILRDITERKQAEKIMIAQRDLAVALAEALTAQEAFRLCLEAAIKLTDFDSGSIYITDSATGNLTLALIRGVSETFSRVANREDFIKSRSRFIMQGIAHYIEGDEIRELSFKEAMLEEGIQSVAFIPIKLQAQVIGGLVVASHAVDRIAPSIRNALETIAGQIGTAIAKVQSEEALRESELKFRDLAEKSMVGIYLIQENIFKYVNAEFTRISGYEVHEIVNNMDVLDLIHEDDASLVAERIRKRITGEVLSYQYQFRIRTKYGDVKHVEVFSSRTLYKGQPAIIGMILDITSRLRTEEELRRLSIAIEQAAEDIIITDPEGVIQYVNPAFEKITGYSRIEAIGQTPRFMKSGTHDPAFYHDLWNTVKNGNIWRGIITNKCKDGRLILEDSTITPMLTSKGELTGYVALKRDVTDTMRIEAQLRQAQKMEAIGTMAGGIAHDFNNILSAIMGYAELTKIKTSDQTIYPYLERMLQACDRSKDLVMQILTFSRQREQEKKPVAVTSIVKEAMKLLRSSLPTTVEIRQFYHTGHDTVLADPTQIHQVLMNLCTNAVHAMRDRQGVLEVRLEEQVISARDRAGYSLLKDGAYLQLVVSDTGEGIDPLLKDKIFDPFFTTKRQGEGTGLGLSVVYGIVKDIGGFISVDSEPGKGTVFTISLPLIDAGGRKDQQRPDVFPKGRGTVLYVDDEEPIASIGQEMLSSLGYDVTVRFSSRDALEAFRAQPERYDLVITDMTMPSMTGAVLAREILKIRPYLPIILTTGFSETIDEAEAKKIGIREYLMKPVALTDLAQAVHRALRQNTAR